MNRRPGIRIGTVILAAALAGCGYASAPIKDTPQVVATPINGQLSVAVGKSKPVGQVVPVHVSVANGTDISRAIVPSQIFAINNSGERVAPLPPGEAARQAGNAGELKAVLISSAVSGAALGAVGAGLGAAVGAVTGGVPTGAIIGTAIGAGSGIYEGAPRGQDKADQQANQQLASLSLQPQDVAHNFTVSGYVFFPKGDYREIQILMVNRESGDTEVISRPWP